ncbi:hypothetical protein E2C06_18675 [Dankookia rubra]|uniref:Uncharacterized protein n=1 Tax=Dankookia rubra TaxID=1442381 RepID=A0A4R5QEM2_9PROT|nr:hypothetical protein [Dankookia rubra]TDH61128.1 hypothetical protein E2C06_18675 [Dankookia rubra]
MTADFLANDFGAIARAMRRETSSSPAVLHFWGRRALPSSTQESVEAAVAEAYRLVSGGTGTPFRITTPEGSVLMDDKALAEAVIRYGERTPVQMPAEGSGHSVAKAGTDTRSQQIIIPSNTANPDRE